MGESFSDRDLTTLGKLIDAMNFRSEWPQCKLLATKILKKKERASERAKERGGGRGRQRELTNLLL